MSQQFKSDFFSMHVQAHRQPVHLSAPHRSQANPFLNALN